MSEIKPKFSVPILSETKMENESFSNPNLELSDYDNDRKENNLKLDEISLDNLDGKINNMDEIIHNPYADNSNSEESISNPDENMNTSNDNIIYNIINNLDENIKNTNENVYNIIKNPDENINNTEKDIYNNFIIDLEENIENDLIKNLSEKIDTQSLIWDAFSADFAVKESSSKAFSESSSDFHTNFRSRIFAYVNDSGNVRLKRVLDAAVASMLAKRPSDPLYFLVHELMRLNTICDVSSRPSHVSAICDEGESRSDVSSGSDQDSSVEEETKDCDWNGSELMPFW